ncbi:MAG: hypothetical protein LBO02_00310 [Holosporaceae bacterium]|jgi:hypothetical protein|nr:hypothetical protein [Holosporaceae bacterium]
MKKNVFNLLALSLFFHSYVIASTTSQTHSRLQNYTDSKEETSYSEKKPRLRHVDYESRNKAALEELSSKSIVIKSKTAERDPDIIIIDLFDGKNLPIILSSIFDYALDENNYDENFKLPRQLAKNQSVRKSIVLLRDAIKELANFSQTDFENSDFSQAYAYVMKKFPETLEIAEKCRIFHEKHLFLRYLKAAKKAVDLVWIRYTTEKLLSKIRTALEENLQNTSGSISQGIAIHIPTPIPTLTVDVGTSVSENFGGTETSLYTVSKSKEKRGGLSFNFGFGKLIAAGGVEQVSTEIFYSLEQVLDSYGKSNKLSKQRLAPELKGAASNRQSMQKKEKELIVLMEEIEGLAKIFKTVPNDAVFSWVDITKSQPTDKSEETKAFFNAYGELSAYLMSAGIDLKASKGSKIYSRESSVMSLINEDCSVAGGLTADNLVKILGSDFDLSSSVPEPNIQKGLLTAYVGVLIELANTNDKKEKKKLEDKKHEYEKLISPTKKLGSYGRNGVLKAGIVTAAKLKEKDIHGLNDHTFRQIYIVLDNLSKLSEFSKNKSGMRNFFGYGEKEVSSSCAKATTEELKATLNLYFPAIGTTVASLEKKIIEGSPFKEENGKYVSLKFSLPLAADGTVGMFIVGDKLFEILSKVSSKAKLEVGVDDLRDVAQSMASSSMTTKAEAAAQKEIDKFKNMQKKIKSDPQRIDFYQKVAEKAAQNAIKEYKISDEEKEITAKYAAEKVIRAKLENDISDEELRANSMSASAGIETSPIGVDSTTNSMRSDDASISERLGAGALGAGSSITFGAQTKIEAYGATEFDIVFRYVPPTEDYSEILPLPGFKKVIENPTGRWVLDYVKMLKTLNKGISTPASLPVSLKRASTFGKMLVRTGSDTLHDIISKSNAFKLGLADSKSGINTAYMAMKERQLAQLLRIFKNINDIKSNAIVELQDLYNQIMNNMTSNEEKRQCKKVFKDFLDACRPLGTLERQAIENEFQELSAGEDDASNSVDPQDPNIKAALDALDKVVDMNYEYNFKIFNNNAYS